MGISCIYLSIKSGAPIYFSDQTEGGVSGLVLYSASHICLLSRRSLRILRNPRHLLKQHALQLKSTLF